MDLYQPLPTHAENTPAAETPPAPPQRPWEIVPTSREPVSLQRSRTSGESERNVPARTTSPVPPQAPPVPPQRPPVPPETPPVPPETPSVPPQRPPVPPQAPPVPPQAPPVPPQRPPVPPQRPPVPPQRPPVPPETPPVPPKRPKVEVTSAVELPRSCRMGLMNEAGKNKCWMNASLQVLLRMNDLMRKILEVKCDTSGVATNMQNVFKSYKKREYKMLQTNAMKFKQGLRCINDIYTKDEQLDATEFISQLISHFEVQYADLEEFIKENMYITFEAVCTGCGKKNPSDSNIVCLLPMEDKVCTVQELFERRVESIGSTGTCNCTSVGFQRQVFISKYSRYLFLQLLRFTPTSGGGYAKLFTRIDTSVTLHITKWITSTRETQRNIVYKIHSVISHIGEQISKGHYLADINEGNQWIRFNDMEITSNTTLLPNVDENGYLFLYTLEA